VVMGLGIRTLVGSLGWCDVLSSTSMMTTLSLTLENSNTFQLAVDQLNAALCHALLHQMMDTMIKRKRNQKSEKFEVKYLRKIYKTGITTHVAWV